MLITIFSEQLNQKIFTLLHFFKAKINNLQYCKAAVLVHGIHLLCPKDTPFLHKISLSENAFKYMFTYLIVVLYTIHNFCFRNVKRNMVVFDSPARDCVPNTACHSLLKSSALPELCELRISFKRVRSSF